ncbi:hypothetical protein FKP32DRAFT_1128909 [Trametes sanguinea]|nr:hypothetical protein FKP32DRAFT_1128909 [Trametes sanguinea]
MSFKVQAQLFRRSLWPLTSFMHINTESSHWCERIRSPSARPLNGGLALGVRATASICGQILVVDIYVRQYGITLDLPPHEKTGGKSSVSSCHSSWPDRVVFSCGSCAAKAHPGLRSSIVGPAQSEHMSANPSVEFSIANAWSPHPQDVSP